MNVVSKPIKAIAVFEYEDANKPPMPYKFKMKEDSGEEITVVVDKFFATSKRRIGGEECIIYQCQSVIRDAERKYELKYNILKCSWQLYKI